MLRFISWVFFLGGAGLLVWEDFIKLDVNLPYKFSFVGLVVLFVLFLVFWGNINDKIKRRLQAIENAREMQVVGKTSPLKETTLKNLSLWLPLMLASALFILAGQVFNDVGYMLLKISGMYAVPISADYISNRIAKTKRLKREQLEQQKLYAGVVDEMQKRGIK